MANDKVTKVHPDKHTGNPRVDRYSDFGENGSHEHSWYKWDSEGGHEEGWVGRLFERFGGKKDE